MQYDEKTKTLTIKKSEVDYNLNHHIDSYLDESGAIVKNLIIEYGVKEIPDWSLKHISVDNIYIPDSVEEIGNRAFAESKIKSISLPETYFRGQEILEKSTVESVEIRNTGHRKFEIPCYTFRDCKELKTVKIPNDTDTIGPGAFEGCQSLTEIDLSNVKHIDRSAFEGCRNFDILEQNLSELEVFGIHAFDNCKYSRRTGHDSNSEASKARAAMAEAILQIDDSDSENREKSSPAD